MIKNFLQELRTQRWDDHRFYHHSRINQSLHFVSALSFLFAYVMPLEFRQTTVAERVLLGKLREVEGKFLLEVAAGGVGGREDPVGRTHRVEAVRVDRLE